MRQKNNVRSRRGLMLVLGGLLAAASCSTDEDMPAQRLIGCERFAAGPILMIHGSGLDAASWDRAIEYLRATGYPREYLTAVSLAPDDGDNVAAAEEQIRRAADELLAAAARAHRRSDCDGPAPVKLHVVGHSMGAFSGRWFVIRVAPDISLSLTSIGGANHGTDALCPLTGTGNQQMCPAYLQAELPTNVQMVLNGTRNHPMDETPYGPGPDADAVLSIRPNPDTRIIYVTLRIEPDEWIVPARSAELDGAGGILIDLSDRAGIRMTSDGNYRLDATVAHDDLPAHPSTLLFLDRVFDAIDRYASNQ